MGSGVHIFDLCQKCRLWYKSGTSRIGNPRKSLILRRKIEWRRGESNPRPKMIREKTGYTLSPVIHYLSGWARTPSRRDSCNLSR